jgi:hypothetical protein
VNRPRSFLQALLLTGMIFLLGTAGPSQAAPKGRTLEELERKLAERDRKLAERDAVIADLLRRVESLERQVGQSLPTASDAQRSSPPPAPQADARTGAAAARNAPVDRDEAAEDSNRALERSLVITGGLLLPAGTFELQPSIQYSFSRIGGVPIATGTGVTTAARDVRSDNVTASLGLRAGLPWTSQLDITLPFLYGTSDVIIGGTKDSTSAAGLGDLQVGLSKQLTQDREWVPGLIGSVTWKPATASASVVNLFSPTNTASRPISLTTGFDAVALGLTAIKRKDPLVFFGGYAHSFVFPDRRGGTKVSPGDSNGMNVGAILAASPDVSLRSSFNASYTDAFRLNGRKVEGSGEVIGTFEVGTSVTLSDSVLLDVVAGAGVTSAAPDFLVNVSMPIRF